MKTILPALLFAVSLSAAPPVRVLILTGQSDYPYHDWRSTTPFLESLLERTGRFDVRVVEEPKGISAATLADYDVLVLNYNGPRWGAGAEAAVEQFVRSGKGLVSLHGVTYGPLMGTVLKAGGGWSRQDGWSTYSDMLGFAWDPANIGNAVRHAFEIEITDQQHPITRGMNTRFTVNDELYHRMDLKPGARVLLTAYSDPKQKGTGKQEPLAWAVTVRQRSNISHAAWARHQRSTSRP